MANGQDPSGQLATEAIADLGPAYAAGFNWAMGISGVAVGMLGVITVLLLVIGLKQDKDRSATP